jgi:hypothetical protein
MKLFILSMLCFNFVKPSYSQDTLQNYIIITYENSFALKGHGMKTYNWILPERELSYYNDYSLYRVLINSQYKSLMQDCIDKKPFAPSVVKDDESFILDSARFAVIDNLQMIIKQKRRKIQWITKEITTGQIEYINIYATPVSGIFCHGTFHPLAQINTKYSGDVYLPYASFQYNSLFWVNEKAKYLLSSDFLTLNYKSISEDIIP